MSSLSSDFTKITTLHPLFELLWRPSLVDRYFGKEWIELSVTSTADARGFWHFEKRIS